MHRPTRTPSTSPSSGGGLRLCGSNPGANPGAILVALLALLLLTIPATASDDEAVGSWPSFRGAQRDGISSERGIADSWPAGGPPVRWRQPIGAGFSGIAVGGGRAFTLDQQDGHQRVVAFEAASGVVLWTTTTGPAFASEYGDGPRATPVLEGERVYVVDAGARLGALDVESGEVLWGHDLPASFGARVPPIGFSSTPILEGNLLIIEVGAEDGAFMAFDKHTGERVWSSQSDQAAYVAPIVLEAAGRRQVVFYSGSGLYALTPEDGSLLWHAPWPSPCPATGIPLNAASPVFLPPDRVFAAAAWGENKGGAMFQISASESGIELRQLWHQAKAIDGEISTPVRVGDFLYGFKGSVFQALDANSGEAVWQAQGYGRGSLIVADGKLIVLGERGNLALVEATPSEYRQLASTPLLNGRSWTSPSLAGRQLYVRNEKEIIRVDLANHPKHQSVAEAEEVRKASPAPGPP